MRGFAKFALAMLPVLIIGALMVMELPNMIRYARLKRM